MNKLNIDIVDDCEVILSIVSFELSKRPQYNVRTFKSGDEYLKSERDSDLLVLDHNMPSGHSVAKTGLQVLSELGDSDSNAPVIYLSGQADISTAVKAIRKGASDYVSKEADDFVAVLTEKIDVMVSEMDQKDESMNHLSGAILSGANIFALVTTIAALLIIICV